MPTFSLSEEYEDALLTWLSYKDYMRNDNSERYREAKEHLLEIGVDTFLKHIDIIKSRHGLTQILDDSSFQ
jgi:hypothetical protein